MQTELPLSGMHTLSNIYDETFCENIEEQKAVNYFCEKRFHRSLSGSQIGLLAAVSSVTVVTKQIKRLVSLKMYGKK